MYPKRFIIGLILCLWNAGWAEPLIIDHTCTDLTQVPLSALQSAKDTLHIGYGHTSHGSQITDGMTGLVSFINNGGLGLSYPTDFFAWNNGGTGGALDLEDGDGYGDGWLDHDAGYYPNWVNETRAYLDDPSHADVNVIIWSWCGQVSGYTEQQMIDQYLAPMSQLELDYPNVTFVYMTGHLDGGGLTGNLNVRNQQIRDYCIANEKTLYDFADIESYDPDGLVNYMPLLCNDNCDYDSDGNGSRDSNWALDWQGTHPENVDWYSCGSAHTQPLNANRKAYAAWWLWACIAGWQGPQPPCLPAPTGLAAEYEEGSGQVTLTWTDNSDAEDSFLIQRQVDENPWNQAYDSTDPNITTWGEILTEDGTYRYRVIAHLDDDGTGNPCDSAASNTVTVIVSSQPPAAPSNLQTTLNGNTIQITWTDNSDNEEVFVLERAADSGSFVVRDDLIAANTTLYTDADLPIEHTYTYRVLARNTNGDSPYSNTDSEYVPLTSTTIRLYSTSEIEDSFLQSANPDTNYGGTAYLSNTERYIMKFILPAEVMGRHVISARLGLYIWQVTYNSEDHDMQLYRVAADWDEMSVTWNSASAGLPWQTPGGDVGELLATVPVQDIDHQYIDPPTDMTSMVQQWVTEEVANQGVVLVNESASSLSYKASEYSGSHTYLDITYDDSCPYPHSADFTGDCCVDMEDLAEMGRWWGIDAPAADIAPAGGDGIVDLYDLAELALQWLAGCS